MTMTRSWPPLIGAMLPALVLALMPGCRRDEPTKAAEKTEAPTPAAPPKTDLNYALVRTLESGLEQLNGIAIDSKDNVYLAGAGGVRVVDADGKLLSAWATSGPAKCVAVDADANVYVGLTTRIEKYGKDGKLLASWGTEGKERGQLQVVSGIAIYGANVYVADAGNRCVHRFDITGDFIDDIGKRRTGDVGMVCPSPYLDCALDKDGILYVNNPGLCRVERYDQNGKRIGMWGDPGDKPEDFSGCCNPSNIALLPDGRVITSEKLTPRVKVYDDKGAMLAYIGPEFFSQMAEGLDVAADSKGSIFVVDPNVKKVLVFSLAKSEKP